MVGVITGVDVGVGVGVRARRGCGVRVGMAVGGNAVLVAGGAGVSTGGADGLIGGGGGLVGSGVGGMNVMMLSVTCAATRKPACSTENSCTVKIRPQVASGNRHSALVNRCMAFMAAGVAARYPTAKYKPCHAV